MQENTIIINTGTKRHCLNNVRNILWASHWNTSRFKRWNQLICSNWQYAELIAVKMYYNNILQTFSRTSEALIKHFKDYSNTTFHSFKKKSQQPATPSPFVFLHTNEKVLEKGLQSKQRPTTSAVLLTAFDWLSFWTAPISSPNVQSLLSFAINDISIFLVFLLKFERFSGPWKWHFDIEELWSLLPTMSAAKEYNRFYGLSSLIQ